MTIDKYGRKWFKGNLHTHTTRSDGGKSPEESAAIYRAAGYDFMSFTDHWIYGEGGYTDDGMLILSGCEYHLGTRPTPEDGIYHIIANGTANEPEIDRISAGVQDIIDGIAKVGGFIALAHPAWSLNRPECFDRFTGIDAIEIFNSVSDLPRNCRPYSGAFADTIAAAGHFPLLIAVDDTHFYNRDACRSYIMVNAEELTRESILEALRSGRFYSTQGPEIFVTKREEDGCIVIETSDVSTIIVYSDSVWVNERIWERGDKPLTGAIYKPVKSDSFVRVEAVDSEGRTAWSNFIRL